MPKFICETCGTQFPEMATPPLACPICNDERQYVTPNGQSWITLGELENDFHNEIIPLATNFYSIVTKPKFGIGQQAHLIQSPKGNVLWDCVSYLDDKTIDAVKELGGIKSIAISHPHYYSTMLEWADAFDATIYLHAADEIHVVNNSKRIHFWQGESLSLQEGLSLVNSAGHYDGGTVLHWQEGTNGKGALLTGDIIQVVADTRWVSFMYSYPNSIPLSASKIRRIVDPLAPYSFEKIYGAFGGIVQKDAKNAVKRSAQAYIKAITDEI